ncbi:hypothetical protein [Curtobacterium sp. MCLR17_058]|uniref:hypothetical protein n=1 Tax=Curtobacterium sp. MCLR17_058 TaxID=2175635 RepID=UPI0011B83F18|nr:hypothetical protein [Curtobacterium sp. MCLR17_058]WIB42669.1 hypothetical protein DEJ11_17825 [Curtobacterium sp. MCLR17_058]
MERQVTTSAAPLTGDDSDSDLAVAQLARIRTLVRRRRLPASVIYGALLDALEELTFDPPAITRPAPHDPVAHRVAVHTREVLRTLTVREAAQRLHTTAADIRDAIDDQQLVAHLIHGEDRLQRWQFADTRTGVLPHTAQIARAVAQRHIGPLKLDDHMATPQTHLVAMGELTPITWLARFRPAAVIEGLERISSEGRRG